MFTVHSLREMADVQERMYRQLLEQHPPGTVHEGRNNAHDMMERARICADWLEARGLKEAKNVGPFMAMVLSRGQRVRLLSGARVFGTGNAISRGGELASRARVVTVHSFDRGYVDQLENS
jgi:hypothetical protein